MGTTKITFLFEDPCVGKSDKENICLPARINEWLVNAKGVSQRKVIWALLEETYGQNKLFSELSCTDLSSKVGINSDELEKILSKLGEAGTVKIYRGP